MTSLLDKDLFEIILLSLTVSISAILISTLISLPIGTVLGIKEFHGKKIIMRLIYTLMSLPPVLAGLIIYLIFSNSGPLGIIRWLYTPQVMVIAQILLATPIIIGLASAAVAAKAKRVQNTLITLGASSRQISWLVLREARSGIIAAVLTAFGRIFGEVGAVMLVGGNIRHSTRVLTTSIVLETRQGNFDIAIALGIVLLLISFCISSFILRLDKEKFK